MATTKLILDPEIEAEYLRDKEKIERAEHVAWRTEMVYRMAQSVYRRYDGDLLERNQGE
jgi:hypothetical protein